MVVNSGFRKLAVFECVLEIAPEQFRANMKKAVDGWLKLLDRFHRCQKITNSVVGNTMVGNSLVDFIPAYQSTLDALAIGDETLAKQVAAEIQHRAPGKGHRFSRLFAFTLKAAVLEADEFEERLVELENVVPKRGCKQFAGHAAVFRCLLERDEAGVTPAFESLLRGHRKLSVGAGMFNNTPDKYLCVWGVGLANLLLLRGLPVEIDDPLMPRQLLVRKGMSNDQGPISKE